MIDNNTESETSGDTVCQIYETFLYSKITDVSVMQPNALYHYVVMESDWLEPSSRRWTARTPSS